jgi:ribosome maturation factor RimP
MSVVGPAVKLLGFELVACELIVESGRTVLRVYIDSEEGITVRDCEVVSRQVSAILDVEDPILSHYDLEVSSPGADRLLVTQEHFLRFIGHRVKVKSRQARNGRSNFSGLLESVSDGNITVIVEGDTYVLPIEDIDKAKLVPES